jgi:hypothetical protein
MAEIQRQQMTLLSGTMTVLQLQMAVNQVQAQAQAMAMAGRPRAQMTTQLLMTRISTITSPSEKLPVTAAAARPYTCGCSLTS